MIETCWSNFKCFNVKKFYVCALVGVLIKSCSSLFFSTQASLSNFNAALAALKYGSEAWVLKKREEQRLEA